MNMENEQTVLMEESTVEKKVTLAKFGKALLWASLTAVISGFAGAWFTIWIGSFYKLTLGLVAMIPVGIGRTQVGKRGIAAAIACAVPAVISVAVMGLVILYQGYYIEDFENMKEFIIIGGFAMTVIGIWCGFSKDK